LLCYLLGAFTPSNLTQVIFLFFFTVVHIFKSRQPFAKTSHDFIILQKKWHQRTSIYNNNDLVQSAAACDETILIAKLLISFTRCVDIPGRTDSLNPDGLDLKPRVLYCICFQIVLVSSDIIVIILATCLVYYRHIQKRSSMVYIYHNINDLGSLIHFERRFIRFSFWCCSRQDVDHYNHSITVVCQ